MMFSSNTVWTGKELIPATIQIEENLITAVLPGIKSDQHFSNQLVLPGFINLHAHFELGRALRQLPRRAGFVTWVQSLQELVAGWGEKEWLDGVRLGMAESLHNGVTSVVDIGNTHANWSLPTPLHLIACREILGTDPDIGLNRFKAFEKALSKALPGYIHRRLALHAPYSTAQSVIQEVMPKMISVHLAESKEELELHQHASGPFREFLDQIYPNHRFKRGGGHPMDFLDELVQPTLLVHCNYMRNQDLPKVRSAGHTVVHCPRSHSFFGHSKVQLSEWLKSGVNVGIGTDSLASNEDLDFWKELVFLHRAQPDLKVEQILEMATFNGGVALGENIGEIKVGAKANIQMVELSKPFDQLLTSRPDQRGILFEGRWIQKAS